MTSKRKAVTVATVRKAHALRGELLVHLETDHPGEVFLPGRAFRVQGGGPMGLAGTLTLSDARPHGTGWILGFEEIGDRTLAERYAGERISVDAEHLVDLARDEYFLHDLPGLEVRGPDDEPLGTVSDVYDTSAAPLLAVRDEEGEALVPFVRQFVSEVDVEGGVIRIRPPAGLLEL